MAKPKKKTAKAKTDDRAVAIWEEYLFMACRECGAKVRYEAPFDLNIFAKDLSTFSKSHKRCKEKII